MDKTFSLALPVMLLMTFSCRNKQRELPILVQKNRMTLRLAAHSKYYYSITNETATKLVMTDVNTTYTLTSIQDSIATIDASSQIGSSDIPPSIMGNQVSADLKGEQTGQYRTDLRTGLLQKSKTQINLEGTLHSMGRDIPVTIRISDEITGTQAQ